MSIFRGKDLRLLTHKPRLSTFGKPDCSTVSERLLLYSLHLSNRTVLRLTGRTGLEIEKFAMLRVFDNPPTRCTLDYISSLSCSSAPILIPFHSSLARVCLSGYEWFPPCEMNVRVFAYLLLCAHSMRACVSRSIKFNRDPRCRALFIDLPRVGSQARVSGSRTILGDEIGPQYWTDQPYRTHGDIELYA